MGRSRSKEAAVTAPSIAGTRATMRPVRWAATAAVGIVLASIVAVASLLDGIGDQGHVPAIPGRPLADRRRRSSSPAV